MVNSAKQCIEGNSCVADIAQGFANYYDSKFYNLLSNILHKGCFQSVFTAISDTPKSFQSIHFTVNEIRFVIRKLKKDVANGLDGISPEMIIYAGEICSLQHSLIYLICTFHTNTCKITFASQLLCLLLNIKMVSLMLTIIIDLSLYWQYFRRFLSFVLKPE